MTGRGIVNKNASPKIHENGKKTAPDNSVSPNSFDYISLSKITMSIHTQHGKLYVRTIVNPQVKC